MAETTPKIDPREADKQTEQPGVTDLAGNPGQTAKVEVVAKGSTLPGVVTSGQATHSTGKEPDGGQPAADVQDATVAGIAPQPVPAPATVLYSTPGGYQVAPAGVPVEDVGSNAVGR